MRKHELLVLRGRRCLLAQLAGAQRTIDQRHGHRLTFAVSENQPIAASEFWGLGVRAPELVDHLTLGHDDAAERQSETDLFGEIFHLDLAEPDFAGKRMIAPVAA